MAQLKIHLTPEFEEALAEYMRFRGLKTKSDAIRLAIQDAVAIERRRRSAPDFSKWLGLGCQGAENPTRRFYSDDDLWS